MPSRAGSREWRSYGVGASAIALGVAFAGFVLIDGYASSSDLFYDVIQPAIYQGILPVRPFVVVGVRAIRHSMELAKALGAAVGALSGPLYYPMLGLGHPNDAGADFGRAWVGFLMLLLLPVNMAIGARVGARVAEWRAAGPHVGDRPETMAPAVARAIGLGVIATAVLILWQANLETSPDPRIAHWEFVHHGILPAVPIAMVGALTAGFTVPVARDVRSPCWASCRHCFAQAWSWTRIRPTTARRHRLSSRTRCPSLCPLRLALVFYGPTASIDAFGASLAKCPWVISSNTYSTPLRVRAVRWYGRDQCVAATSRGPYG